MGLFGMKKAIVTGGTGFVGIHLINELVKRDVEVFALCRPESKNINRLKGNAKVQIIECDFVEIKRLPEIIEDRDIDIFYHLAWEGASGKLRTDYETQQFNVKICCDAVVLAKELGCKKIIGTGTVYEKLCESIVNSESFRTPSFYLLSKKYAYEMMLQLTKKIDLSFVWCTFYHPIGKYIKPEQMMAYAVSCLKNGEQPTFGKAQEPYDIVAVEDIANGLALAGEKELIKTQYYIGSGSPKRLYEYLERVQMLINPKVPLGIGIRPDDGLRFSFDWLDSSDFMRDTGYMPMVDFDCAVRRTEEWIREVEELV